MSAIDGHCYQVAAAGPYYGPISRRLSIAPTAAS
jgi:hypothetical protein